MANYKRGLRYAWVTLSDGQRREFATPINLTQAEALEAIKANVQTLNPGQEIVKIDYNPAFAEEVQDA
jgi:hypothetical protein